MGNTESYSLAKICTWLSENNMKYAYASPNFTTLPFVLVHTGVKVQLNDRSSYVECTN